LCDFRFSALERSAADHPKQQITQNNCFPIWITKSTIEAKISRFFCSGKLPHTKMVLNRL